MSKEYYRKKIIDLRADLAKEKDYCFVEAANPLQMRLVLTTNYAGYTGALRVIEDVYNNALERYR